MPAQEPVNPPSIEPSSTHTWLSLDGRHLEIEAGRPLLHRFCTICRRNFVCDVSSGKWQAVLPRIFDFEASRPSKRTMAERSVSAPVSHF